MKLPSDFLATTCQHSTYRICCEACRVNEVDREYEEACGLVKKLKDEIVDWQTELQGSIDKAAKGRLGADLEKARQHLPAWEQRATALSEERAFILKRIQEQYPATQDERAALFETRAKQKEVQTVNILREQAPVGTPYWVDLVEADPNGKHLTEEPLDRSNIPATPDVLLNDGLGLQTFLMHGKGKALGNRNPSRMPGNGDSRPAVMSFGRARRMFGDLTLEPEADSTKATVASDTPPSPTPRTELAYRNAKGSAVATDHSPEEQWALFKSGALLADTSRLVRQYKKLVALRSRAVAEAAMAEAEKKKAESKGDDNSDVPSPSAIVRTPAPTPAWTPRDGTWPPIAETEAEWNGFVNWVFRCKEADAEFASTMLDWEKSRNTHGKAAAAAITNWQASEDFIHKTSHEPDQKRHYNEAKPLWYYDGKSIGWKID